MSDEVRSEVEGADSTHYLVALLANADGVPNARSPYRLVDSFAGGNNEFADISIEDVKAMVMESKAYADFGVWLPIKATPPFGVGADSEKTLI